MEALFLAYREKKENCYLMCWASFPGRSLAMYIHRRAEQRSGKLMTNYD